MWLVQMIRGRDHNGIGPIVLEQLLHVGEYIRNTESLRQRASLNAVVVANGDKRRSLDLREKRQMRQLSDRPGADERNPEVRRRRSVGCVDRLTTTRSPWPPSRQSMRPTVVPG